ncbi:MAG: PEP-CTERM sorting domain-containing protein [Akkermansia muciniphila]
MKLTSLAVLSLLAALACPIFATDFIVDRVNKENAAASEFFFDSGKGLFWQPGAGGTMGSSAAVDAFIDVWKKNATEHGGDVADMSFLGEWGKVGTTKGTVNQAGIDEAKKNGITAEAVKLLVGSASAAGNGQLTADGAGCWAHASSNVLQYWQSYYGIFSSNKSNLHLGYAVANKQTAVDLLGTQSLELTKWFYMVAPNEGGNVKSAMQSYLTENAYLGQSANAFGEYYPYPSQRNTSANQTRVVDGTGASLMEKLTNLVLSSLDCTINERGEIVQNSYGLISEFTLAHADGLSAAHSLTLYGFGIDDETRLISKLYYADSDDQQYGMRVYYVRSGEYGQTERLFLYDDEACTQLRGYSYVSSLTSIRTADNLKSKGLQYWDGDLEWSGKGENGSIWKQGAGMGSNAEALPDGKTGWHVLVDGTYYDSYFDENRNISFKDAGDVTVEGKIHAGAIKISSGATKFLAANADSSIDGTGNVTISDGASLEACLNLGERAVSVEGSGSFTYAAKEAVKLAGLSVADGASATFKDKGVYEISAVGTLAGQISVKDAAEIVYRASGDVNVAKLSVADTASASFGNGGKYQVECDATMGTISVQESSRLTLTSSGSDVIRLAGLTISEGSVLETSKIKVTGAFRTRASEDMAQVASAAVLLLGDAVGTTATSDPVATLNADLDLSGASELTMESTVDMSGKTLTLGGGTTKKLLNLLQGVNGTQNSNGTYDVTLFKNVGSVDGLSSDPVDANTLFTSDNLTSSSNLVYDSAAKTIVLTSVTFDAPEPTTATLALLGLMGLCARRRRQK